MINPISQSVSYPVSTFCSDVSRREKRVRFRTCFIKKSKLISDVTEVSLIITEQAVSENFSFTDQIRNVGHNIVITFNSTFKINGTIWSFFENKPIAKPAVLSRISSLIWECDTINCTRASRSTVNWSAFIKKISL